MINQSGRSMLGVLVSAVLTTTAVAAGPNAPLPSAKPEAVGMSSQRLANMGDFFRRESERESATGYVMMVARHGKLVYSAAVGLRDKENKRPMTLDTRFRIYSMTKPITSVAVLMLYEEGRFHFDDPVSKFLPAFAESRVFAGVDAAGNITTEPLKKPITIRHLLTHTSGLGYGPQYDSTTPLAKSWGTLSFDAAESGAERIRKLASMPLYSQPGAEWRYSYATDVLGYLVEVVSGMPFDRFLQTRLFDPLGMTKTGFFLPATDVPWLAGVYRRNAQGVLERGDGGPANAPTQAPAFASGGGGLISTAGDYLRFAQMLANKGRFDGKQYLSPMTVELMTSNQVADDAQAKYYGEIWRCLGFGLGVSPIIDYRSAPQANRDGDYTWPGALDTNWLVSPSTGVVAVVLAQVFRGADGKPQRTYQDMHNQVYQAVTDLGPAASHELRN
jgi:CubicO group peptidase (beta-lactamase class C family)